jgi:hypothetical protein
MSNSDFDPNKGEFGIGNGINEYNDQEAKKEKYVKDAPAPEPSRRAAPAPARPNKPDASGGTT